jgi:hypothetical protein
MRDTGSDKAAGQQLAKEADKLCRELHQNSNNPASAKDFIVRNEARNLRSIDLQGAPERKADSQRSAEQERKVDSQSLAQERKSESQRTNQRVENLSSEQQRAEQRLSEQRLALQRTQEQRRAEQREQQAKPADGKFQPSMLDGRNWQKDDSGNFVTRAKDGRLLTADANGQLVDYKSHVAQKHMASQDQMAFVSILFCNPMMLLGMGGVLTMMDQAHGAKTAKMTEGLNKKFDGTKANKQANQSGYASDVQRKAALIAQYTRPMDGRTVSQIGGLGGLAGMSAAIEREDLKKRQDKKRGDALNANAKRPETKVSMPQDKYSMSAKKLMKTKRLIEDEIEKVRGKASLEEVSRLYAQVEVLDKALKRMANF